MSPLDRGRSWVWAAVIVEIIGLSVDAVWHGLIGSEIEPQTSGEMVRHLATVHLVLYVGVGMLFLATAWAARHAAGGRARRRLRGRGRPAGGGGVARLLAPAVPANPFPELAGFVGLAVVIVATIVAGRGARGAAIERR